MSRQSAIRLRLFWAVMFAVGVTLAVHCLAIILLARAQFPNLDGSVPAMYEYVPRGDSVASVPFIATPYHGDLHSYFLFSFQDEKEHVVTVTWKGIDIPCPPPAGFFHDYEEAHWAHKRSQQAWYKPIVIGRPIGSAVVFVGSSGRNYGEVDRVMGPPLLLFPLFRFGKIIWTGMLLNFAIYIGLYFLLATALSRANQWRRRRQGRCEACGYDLHGSADRCPECGVPFVAGDRGSGI